MSVTLLGTGTSQGVPVIGCACPVCASLDARDQRLRTSAWIQAGPWDLIIDCGPDFRQQALRARVPKVDAILLTHEHNDHVSGLDDVRPYNFRSGKDIPIYAAPRVGQEIRKRFEYAFEEVNRYPGAPMLVTVPVSASMPFTIGDLPIIPVEVMHGAMPVLGFRLGNFAYVTDMRTISENEMEKLKGVEVLVVNALHFHAHSTHMNVDLALEFIERLGPRQSYLTHISHRMGLYEDVNPALPSHVALGYDGLQFRL
ncbi:MAG: MBL fold metallo-hydrolase [Haliscomenobacter sp.]|nr:MBL fold metallo-hydrolase [Haliscomenobacter sp.]